MLCRRNCLSNNVCWVKPNSLIEIQLRDKEHSATSTFMARAFCTHRTTLGPSRPTQCSATVHSSLDFSKSWHHCACMEAKGPVTEQDHAFLNTIWREDEPRGWSQVLSQGCQAIGQEVMGKNYQEIPSKHEEGLLYYAWSRLPREDLEVAKNHVDAILSQVL